MKGLDQEKNLKNIELFCGEETAGQSCLFNYEIITRVFNLVGGKWELLVIALLLNGAKRYSDLKKSIPGVSEKILSEVLKKLYKNRILDRRVYSEIPVKVEYSLTTLGLECSNIITAVYKFGEKLENGMK